MSRRISALALFAGVAGVVSGGACDSGPEPIPPAETTPSAGASTVSLSSASVASGSTVTATLQAKNAGGGTLSSGGASVTFSLTGTGTSNGTVSATTDNGNGTYSATITGTTAGTARTVSATLGSQPVTTTLPTLTVTPGPAAPAQSLLTVSSASVASGSTATLTLTTRDAASNALFAGGATVTFALASSSGTSSGTIGAVTDNSNGTYTATFTGTTAGTARGITATIGGTAITSTLPTITVTAGALSAAQSQVSVSAATVQTGGAVTVTLTGRDAAGNGRTSGGGTITFGLGSGTSSGTFSTVSDNGNGTYTAAFTATIAGSARTITATIDGIAVTSTLPTITVTSAPVPQPSPATSIVTISSASVASGSNAAITLQAKDAAGANLTTGGATVTFALGASGSSTGNVGSVSDNGNGTYSATFTGVVAGTARTITATLNGSAVTTAAPTVTVVPGALSLAKSAVTLASSSVAVSGTVGLTLTARDANDNQLGSGGATVAFTTSGGSSAGTIGPVTDNSNGTYSATFSGTNAGTAIDVGATVGGSALTSAKPSLVVYAKGITLSTENILINATTGQAATAKIVAIFANGAQTAEGLQAQVAYTKPSIAACQGSNWLGTPSFDFTTANPVSLLTLNATAASLGIYTCTATITISSTTSSIASKTVNVSLAVARSTVAETAVNLVLMGNAGNNTVQSITPDARVMITNGGRGTVTALRAAVSNQNGTGDTDPWITASDLSWDPVLTGSDTVNRPAPATLVIKSRVKPFTASATITVTGTGISPITIPLSVAFNTNPELVTNPRGVALNTFAGGSTVSRSVLAFNQNSQITSTRFESFAVDAVAQPYASWLSVNVVGLPRGDGSDSAATLTFTVNPTGLLADSVYRDTVRVTAGGSASDIFDMPVTFVVERGLVVGAADVTIFAAAGTTAATRDVDISNGGGTPISGLSASVGGANWLSASFVGSASAPTTVRLAANPTGLPRGTVVQTTVTVSASSPSGVPSRNFPVTLRVY